MKVLLIPYGQDCQFSSYYERKDSDNSTDTAHKPSQLVPVIQGGHWQWYFEESTLSFTQTPSL